MSNRGLPTLWDTLVALQPPPRLVDWSLFVIVLFEVTSGLLSFTVADPGWWPLFWGHRIAGLTLVPLLGFKLYRVRDRITDRAEWQPSTLLSALTLLAALGALGTGIAWAFGLDVRLWYWTLLSVHVGFGLVLVPLVVGHLASRFRLPRRRDFERRRTAIRFGALLVAGLVAYRGQELANRVLDLPGGDRRFTGSQPREGSSSFGSFTTAGRRASALL